MYTPHPSVSTDKNIACLGAQTACLWAGIIIKKVIVKKDRA